MKPKNSDNKIIDLLMTSDNKQELLDNIDYFENVMAAARSPVPHEDLKRDIKSQITKKLAQQKHRRHIIRTQIPAAVAAVLVFASVAIFIITSPKTAAPDLGSQQAVMAANLWESDDIYLADESLENIADEIEQIESDLIAIELGEHTNANGSSETIDIEYDLIEIKSDFWKG